MSEIEAGEPRSSEPGGGAPSEERGRRNVRWITLGMLISAHVLLGLVGVLVLLGSLVLIRLMGYRLVWQKRATGTTEQAKG